MDLKLSIVIPCYNEIKTVLVIIKKLQELKFGKITKEIIVINDFSSDGSKELLENNKKELNFKVLHNDQNYGKGFCVKRGIEESTGDLILFQDADLEYDTNDILKLLQVFENYDADVVYGSRFISSEPRRIIYFWNRVANFLLTFLTNILVNLNLSDMETGYKMFKSKILKKISIKEKSFGIEPEVTIKIARLKVKFFEVGISYNGRTYEEGKKIRLKDAFIAFYCIFKYALFSKK